MNDRVRDVNRKIKYLGSSFIKTLRGQYKNCPSCGGRASITLDSKFIITKLQRCAACGLLFRTPITAVGENEKFYQSEYEEGFTTDMPSWQRLKALLDLKFSGSEKDYTTYVQVLNALGCKPGAALLDFGCSWGYGSWQLMQAGFKVTSFELSRPRCAYARKNLGVDAYSSWEEIKGPFDIFFSAHVLEHVPSPTAIFERAFYLLKPEGFFIALTPNGSEVYKKTNFRGWHQSWGFVHPNLLDEVYYDRQFNASPYLLASSPYNMKAIKSVPLNQCTKINLGLNGSELLFVAKKESPLKNW